MAVPDISSLTPAELVTLIQQANAKYAAAQAATATDVQTRRANAAAAVTSLSALLGPSGAPSTPWMSPRRSPSGRQWPRTRPSPCR